MSEYAPATEPRIVLSTYGPVDNPRLVTIAPIWLNPKINFEDGEDTRKHSKHKGKRTTGMFTDHAESTESQNTNSSGHEKDILPVESIAGPTYDRSSEQRNKL